MKHPSNKKSVALVAKQKAKKTSASTKITAPVKKNAGVSATKSKTAKVEISAAKSKNPKLKISAPTGKIKTADSKKKQIISVQTAKSKTKAVKPKVSNVKTEIAKSQPIVPAKKNKIVKRQKVDDKIKIAKSKKSISVAKVSAAKPQPRVTANKKTPKNENSSQTAKITKIAKLPTNAAIKTTKVVKPQAVGKTKTPVKSQPKVSVKNLQPKISKLKSKTDDIKRKVVAGKKSVKKTAAVNQNKVQKEAAKSEKLQLTSRISKIAKVADQRIVAVHLVKKLELPDNFIEPKNKKNCEKKQSKLIFKAEQPMPAMPKPEPKKAKAISSAVFRGEKNKYDFTVFPLDAVFEDVPAIYIISRRVVDKSKKAHHALVCIGQTESLLDELKKHKKDKRAKKFAANSISLLREENENRRLKIETDLKAAHAIRCLYA